MKRNTWLVAAALVVALPLSAKELAGVKMADKVAVEGKELKLNGIGLRSKAVFKVYVAGLYVEQPSRDAGMLVSSEQLKRVELVMMRDLSKGKISEAIQEGFEKNSKPLMPVLNERLKKFIAAIPDLKEGQKLVITYVPGRGTGLSTGMKDLVMIAGKDFADALYSVWLGKSPVDEKLKMGLTGAG